MNSVTLSRMYIGLVKPVAPSNPAWKFWLIAWLVLSLVPSRSGLQLDEIWNIAEEFILFLLINLFIFIKLLGLRQVLDHAQI